MAFTNLVTDIKPVKDRQRGEFYQCASFTGELSSKTGINSKFMYISKINSLTGELESPIVTITCGNECIDKCINLFKNEK